jgi:serine/threonine protein kinase
MPAVAKVLAALDFLQRQRKLAHGNVKGSNVLLSSNGEVKLSDLSSCKNLREEFKQSSLSIVSSRSNPSDKRFRQAVPLHRAAAALARTRRSIALCNVAFCFYRN